MVNIKLLLYTDIYIYMCVGMHAQSLSHIRIFLTPWTVALWAPLSMGFSSQEYWSGLPLPLPGNLPDPGIESVSPVLVGGFLTTVPPR